MKSKPKKPNKKFPLTKFVPKGRLFPEGKGRDAVLALLLFLQDSDAGIDGEFNHGLPGPSVNLKCFLPKQWDSHERDKIINQIKKTKDVLDPLKGWVFDSGHPFPKKVMKTEHIRFEIRFEPVSKPGDKPQEGREEYKKFMLEEYPKIVREQDLGKAEDERERKAEKTRMKSYMKKRKINQLVDLIDSVKTLDEASLCFVFGTLISEGVPTASAVDKLKAAARRQGCSAVVIERGLDLCNAMTGGSLRGSNHKQKRTAQSNK